MKALGIWDVQSRWQKLTDGSREGVCVVWPLSPDVPCSFPSLYHSFPNAVPFLRIYYLLSWYQLGTIYGKGQDPAEMLPFFTFIPCPWVSATILLLSTHGPGSRSRYRWGPFLSQVSWTAEWSSFMQYHPQDQPLLEDISLDTSLWVLFLYKDQTEITF